MLMPLNAPTQITRRDQRLDRDLIELTSESHLKHLLSLCGALYRGELFED